MAHGVLSYDAIVFDMLDTLYPWGPDRYSKALDALCETVAAGCGLTPQKVKTDYVEIRTRYSAINLSKLIENDFPAFVLELVEGFGEGVSRNNKTTNKVSGKGFPKTTNNYNAKELAKEGVRAYNRAFANALDPAPGVVEMLRRLSTKYKLGVLSNYPTSDGIRDALERDGLADMLGAIVVSAEVGFIKPHPAMFNAVRDALGCKAELILFVGDTWESDVVGAWLAGMPCARVKPSASGVEQGRFFNGHIRGWLESRTDIDWRAAKPLVELDNVLGLEEWLGFTER